MPQIPKKPIDDLVAAHLPKVVAVLAQLPRTAQIWTTAVCAVLAIGATVASLWVPDLVPYVATFDLVTGAALGLLFTAMSARKAADKAIGEGPPKGHPLKVTLKSLVLLVAVCLVVSCTPAFSRFVDDALQDAGQDAVAVGMLRAERELREIEATAKPEDRPRLAAAREALDLVRRYLHGEEPRAVALAALSEAFDLLEIEAERAMASDDAAGAASE